MDCKTIFFATIRGVSMLRSVGQPPRHFLSLLDTTPDELRSILHRAIELKAMHHEGKLYQPFQGKVLGMIFEKSSTRTRISFEAGMSQFGGSAIFLSPRDTQLGRGEPIEDSSRVISRMVDLIMIRTFAHETVERFAQFSRCSSDQWFNR
jgi:ornithine carbamoyltransferase